MIGTRLGHYTIAEQLGAGGMGVVYRAEDMRLGRGVALKVLPVGITSDEAARAALLREARLASALNHPRIATIYEVGEADAQAYIAMELVAARHCARPCRARGCRSKRCCDTARRLLRRWRMRTNAASSIAT